MKTWLNILKFVIVLFYYHEYECEICGLKHETLWLEKEPRSRPDKQLSVIIFLYYNSFFSGFLLREIAF